MRRLFYFDHSIPYGIPKDFHLEKTFYAKFERQAEELETAVTAILYNFAAEIKNADFMKICK